MRTAPDTFPAVTLHGTFISKRGNGIAPAKMQIYFVYNSYLTSNGLNKTSV